MVSTRRTNYSPALNQLANNANTTDNQSLLRSVRKNSANKPPKSNGHNNGNGNGKCEDEKKATSPESGDKTVYIVFFSLLLDLLAFTMILPLLPSLIEHYSKNDKGGLYSWLLENVKVFQQKIGAPENFNSVLFGGALGSMYSFLQFVASPIVGGLSDVYGRKLVMIICLVGISLSYVVWAVSSNFALFVLARFIGGLSKGNVSLSMAIISDVSNVKNRGKGMALVGIAFSLGFIFGPIIGALFSLNADKSNQNWYIYPAIFAFLLSLADLLFVTLCLKESLPKEKRAKGIFMSLSRAMSFILVSDLFNFKAVQKITTIELTNLQRLGYVYFIYLFIYSGLEFTITFLTHHTYGYTSMQQGKMFFVIGLIMAVLQGGVVRRLPDKYTLSGAKFGLCIIPLSFLSIAFAGDKTVYFGIIKSIHFLYFGLFLYAVSTAFVVSCLTTLVSQIGAADQRGTILGVFRSLGALARAIGPIIASFIYWSLGPFTTYGLGGVMLLIPIILLKRS